MFSKLLSNLLKVRKTTLDKMPLHIQSIKVSYCVPYSLAGVAQYFGLNISKEDVIELCNTHKTQGTSLDNCSKAVKKIGLRFRRIKFTPKNVFDSLSKGNPVVICYATSDKESHFSTIIKVKADNGNQIFYTLNDTLYGRYDIPEELLKYLIKRDGSWTRIVEKI